MLKASEKYVTAEAYFQQEDTAEYRSEYFYGDVFAMTGGTPNHNRISVNIASLLNAQFKGGPCEAFTIDLRVEVEKGVHYAYPDVVVVCGEMKLADGRSDTLTNPVVIMEVLSRSTRDYDRGSKFTAYRRIETLTDYLLIDQEKIHIEHFSRESDGSWRLWDYFGSEEPVEIKSIGAVLPIDAMYERVAFVLSSEHQP
jgi:Uma2 family endonuclease